jgi:hypothetical protein
MIDIDAVRDAFEKWAAIRGYRIRRETSRHLSYHYRDNKTQKAWEVWEAAKRDSIPQDDEED